MNMYMSSHPDATRPVLPNFVSKGHRSCNKNRRRIDVTAQTWAVWRYQNPLRSICHSAI